MTELAIQEVFPIWLNRMRRSLVEVDIGQAFAENPENAWPLLKVRYAIFKVSGCLQLLRFCLNDSASQTLTRLAAAFPRCIADHVGEYVQSAVQHLHVLMPYYIRYYVSNTDDQAEPPTDNGTDDRHAVGLDQVMNAITDLLTSYTRIRKARDIVFVKNGKGKYDKCSPLADTMMFDLLAVAQISRENVSLLVLRVSRILICTQFAGGRMVR